MILKEEGLSERECVSIHSALTESLSFGKKHCKSGSITGNFASGKVGKVGYENFASFRTHSRGPSDYLYSC